MNNNKTSKKPTSKEGQLSVDVFQSPNEITIVAPIAGVDPSDISITITDDVITIKGERTHNTTLKKDDCFIQECFWGSFSRSVVLPADVDTSAIAAECNNNVLVVTIPRIERIRTRVVKVKK